jgi:hypothetical protein
VLQRILGGDRRIDPTLFELHRLIVLEMQHKRTKNRVAGS